ncbi:MAG: cobalt-precorrin-7 (C(5))-methyltransferase [Methanomicrobiales archaeon]|nr:cobalt-precorrin-7 (C(5))-methyltransferase [Methanomicrobiales archaeon]
MKIVGVGCGPGMLTEQAIRALARATDVYGSRRALDLAAPHLPPGCTVQEITDYKNLRSLPADAVVLSTGDPMLAGLGYLGGEIIPGISSLQVACARLGISLAGIAVVTAHGRDHGRAVARTLDELGRGKTVFIIADPAFDVGLLGAEIARAGRDVRIALCERLGYPDERIAVGTPVAPPAKEHELFVLCIGVF